MLAYICAKKQTKKHLSPPSESGCAAGSWAVRGRQTVKEQGWSRPEEFAHLVEETNEPLVAQIGKNSGPKLEARVFSIKSLSQSL